VPYQAIPGGSIDRWLAWETPDLSGGWIWAPRLWVEHSGWVDAADDVLVLCDPWWDLRGDAEDESVVREALTQELAREVKPGHPLSGSPVEVLARCGGCDDVVVGVGVGDRWAIVHLTYATNEWPPWPKATLFNSPREIAAAASVHQH